MAAKKRLLMGLVNGLPLMNTTCYFCLANTKINGSRACDTCDYAKHHGDCTSDENSTWRKTLRAQGEFKIVLNSYYSGETYTDPAKAERYAKYQELKAEFEVSA